MINEKTVGVVIPAFNEEKNIGTVIENLPSWIDKIFVIDDGSKDNTSEVCQEYKLRFPNINLIKHKKNMGVGQALITGYQNAIESNIDVTLVMAGDNQMDPHFINQLIYPIIEGRADFTKTTRVKLTDSRSMIPKRRWFGNIILTFLTKFISGYWNISDCQSGYTAVSLSMLKRLPIQQMYKKYGQPNDLLILLNIENARISEVVTPPRYNVGEVSKMKIWKLFFTLPPLFVKRFVYRIFVKYLIKDTHPIFLLYSLGLLFILVTIALFLFNLYSFLVIGYFENIKTISNLMFFFMAMYSLSQAFILDYEINKDLVLRNEEN
jgi:glycosyltransferase involved in cell wall biosynthesis